MLKVGKRYYKLTVRGEDGSISEREEKNDLYVPWRWYGAVAILIILLISQQNQLSAIQNQVNYLKSLESDHNKDLNYRINITDSNTRELCRATGACTNAQ